MQATCDLNTRIGADKKLAHFVVSYNQDKPSEAVLRDTEDSMLAVMKLDKKPFRHVFAQRQWLLASAHIRPAELKKKTAPR